MRSRGQSGDGGRRSVAVTGGQRNEKIAPGGLESETQGLRATTVRSGSADSDNAVT